MDNLPTKVGAYELLNPDKVRRALEGQPARDGHLVGGILKQDGTYDDAELLAHYDKLAGAIMLNGDKVKHGSFWDVKNKKPRSKPEVMLVFRINGEVVEVSAEKELPPLVKAARVVEEAKAKKKSKNK